MANWITTDEASQLSGYSIQYLQRLLRDKKIAGEKKGGAYWIDRESLVAYKESNHLTKDRRFGARKKLKPSS